MTTTKTHRWADVKRRKLSDEKIATLRAEADRELLEMDLRALREAAGKTQTDVAALAGMSQGELSRFEARDDRKLSTLRRYVEALGGELEVVAVLNGQRIKLAGV